MTEGHATRPRPPFQARLWWSRRALALHVTLIVVLPLFAWAFLWQVQRVRQGNELSWAYVFEWPFFAAYAVYLWWKLLHDQAQEARSVIELPHADGTEGNGAAPDVEAPDAKVGDDLSEEDEELAAYNRYLAELNASGRRKHW